LLSGLLGAVAGLARGMVAPLVAAVGWLGRQVRRVWRAHLDLSELDAPYVAALGTIAAATFGGEPAAAAAVAVVTVLVAVSAAMSNRHPTQSIGSRCFDLPSVSDESWTD
jgi:hypothetical protein